MKKFSFTIVSMLIASFLFLAAFSPVYAQFAAGQDKFLGNIHTKGQTPLNFDVYWNQVTPGNAGKWASCEQQRDDLNYWLWLDRAYDFAKQNNFPFKLHTLVWGHWSGEPSWMSSVPVDEQKAEVVEWFEAVAERYSDIDMIDVVNEPLHAPPSYTEALGGDGATGWDWVIWSFEKARELFPESTLILNEYNVLNYTNECKNFLEIVLLLKERGLIDAVGLQAHSLESIDFATIQKNLDMIAATGLDIYISEYDVRGDDATQLALFQKQFPLFWEHPSVKGVTLWGYLEGDMWRAEAYLLAADGVTERPAMQWLRSYFDYDPVDITYSLKTTVSGNGSLSVSPQADGYAPFTDVTLTALPEEGYVFSHWTGDLSGASNPVTLSMTSSRSVTANFVTKGSVPVYNGCVEETPITMPFKQNGEGTFCWVAEGSVSYINSWNMDTVQINNQDATNSWVDKPVAAVDGKIHIRYEASVSWSHFEIIGTSGSVTPTPVKTFKLTTRIEGQGSVTPSSGTYNQGETVTLTATAADGYQFQSWSGDVSGSKAQATLVMDNDKSVVAIFVADEPDQETFELSVSVDGNGSVTPSAGSYAAGTTVTLTATPDSGHEFAGWDGDMTGSNSTIDIIMDGDKSVTASFILQSSPQSQCEDADIQVVTLPASVDGPGTFCLFTTGDISYVNSWVTDSVTINGVDYTNTWSSSMPAKQNGGYTIRVEAPYNWSHFEAKP